MRPASHPHDPLGDSVERLIEAARGGDRQALGELLEGFRLLLLAEARAKLPRELAGKAGASDLVQSTFLEAQRDFGAFKGTSEGELRKWLCRILDRNVQNLSRAFAREMREIQREVALAAGGEPGSPGQQLASPSSSPSEQASQREEEELLRQALAQLSDDEQRVIRLRQLEQRSYEDIAGLMGITVEAARKRFARTVEKLQDKIEQLQPEPRTQPPAPA